MHTNLLFLIQGLFLGALISIPFGPVNIICLNKTIQRGRIKGFLSTIGSPLADAIYAFIACLGLKMIIDFLQEYIMYFEIFAGIILLVFGIILYRKSFKNTHSKHETFSNSTKSSMFHSFLFSISNPLTVLFFLSYLTGMGGAKLLPSHYQMILFVSGVFAGAALWFYSLSGIVSRFRNYMSMKKMQQINYVCSGILCVSGIVLISIQLIN